MERGTTDNILADGLESRNTVGMGITVENRISTAATVENTSTFSEYNETSVSGHTVSDFTFYITLVLIWIPGFVTNLLALFFIIRDIRKAMFPAILLLFVLCFSDLLAVSFSFMRHILDRYTDTNNIVVCSSVSIIHSLFKLYSGVVNSFMAVDRVLALCTPFYYKRNVDVTAWKLGCLFAAFGVACLNCFPLIGLGNYMGTRRGVPYCNVLGYKEEPVERVYGLIYAILCNLCVMTIVIGNIIVIRTVLKMKKRRFSLGVRSESTASDSDISSNKEKVSAFEITFAKIMGCLALAYLMSAMPLNVLTMMDQFDVKYSQMAVGFIHLLSGLRWSADPCVYILIRKINKKRLTEIFCSCKR